jgi:glycosyltransferase involved in cell wall biosynthesis
MSRIAVLEVVASSRGGGAVHVRDLALGLDAGRFAVTVAMPADGGHVGEPSFSSSGVGFVKLPIASGFSWPALAVLRRLASRADILHVHGARAALFGRLAAASLGKRRPQVVYTIHGFAAPHYGWARRSLLLGVEILLKPWTRRVIAVSEAERRAFTSATPYAPHDVEVIHNGIALTHQDEPPPDRASLRQALGLPVDGPLVITVCRLYRPRDFPTLLRALAQLVEQSPCRLLIVGDGPYRNLVEAEIAALGLAKRVSLLGFRADVRALLRASDLFVLSTALWEGLPLTLLEAMDAGLPVVASRVGGIAEAVLPGETGLLVTPQDPQALCEALRTLLTDGALAARLGAAGKQRVAASFGSERMVKDTADLYLRLARD